MTTRLLSDEWDWDEYNYNGARRVRVESEWVWRCGFELMGELPDEDWPYIGVLVVSTRPAYDSTIDYGGVFRFRGKKVA